MQTLFFVPLIFIAFWETNLDTNTNRLMKSWFSPTDEGEEEDPAVQNPEVSEADGLKICTVPFGELLKKLPDTTVVSRSLSYTTRGIDSAV